MKKLFGLLSACLLSLCLLVSCGSKFGSVKKAFEKAEYTVTAQTIEEENSVIKSVSTVIKGNNILKAGILLELGSTDDLDAAIEELKKDPDFKNYSALLKDAKKIVDEKGLTNGNCVFLSLDADTIAIFKNA